MSEANEDASARTRGERHEIVTRWCDLIASGKLERFAAIGLAPYNVIHGWVTRDPEFKEMLADAHARKKQRLIDMAEDAPMTVGKSEDDGVHPAAAALVVKHSHWRLEKEYRTEYGPTQRTEISGPDGGPIQTATAPSSDTPADIAREALALLSPEERAAILAAMVKP